MPSPFKALGAVLCLVFALGFAAPYAQADSFTPVFNTTGCVGTCLLPTALDVTFPSPTTMTVTFDGLSKVVIIPSGDLPGDTYSWLAIAIFHPLPVGNTLGFDLVDDGGGGFVCGGLSNNDIALSCGTLTFTAVATPEPSSLALMLSTVGLVFAMRKRVGQGLASPK